MKIIIETPVDILKQLFKGEDILKFIFRWSSLDKHRDSALCPICKEDCKFIGITDIVYTFEPCNCGEPDYTHLVEQLWHKKCFKSIS